ncbi:probable thiopurine S-methyltransferase [Rhopilema esculentum]|uniref:probable thiopurine S-methyltransferase n=1 Tax=Rhopilema esculentum TaxID=499914 RepID=UPI0031E405E2
MDSASVQNSDLSLDRWKNSWKDGRAPWHEGSVNSTLEKFFHLVEGDKKGLRILFPLCGKSFDMKWTADQGHVVVGVEGSDIGAKEFFKEHNIEYKMDAINMAPRGALIFSSLDEKIRIFVCDMFDFRSTVAGGEFDGVFDRGALVAINPKDRPRYAELMGRLVAPGGKILAECLEYDPSLYGGPPHHVPEHHIKEIYGQNFNVEQVEKVVGTKPSFKSRFNLDHVHVCSYVMTRK